jgi:hypothetical protein
MHNVGAEMDPVWICKDTGCLRDYAADTTATLMYERHRAHRLVQSVVHGVGPRGHRDWGRFDIVPDAGEGCLFLRPNPDAGHYRVVQIGNE